MGVDTQRKRQTERELYITMTTLPSVQLFDLAEAFSPRPT